MNSRPSDDVGTPIASPPGGRDTQAQIDLDAIRHNVQQVIRQASPARVMTVVKGNAYGHGAIAIAREALSAGASWLGVYTADEGVALRSANIHAPILVLGPLSEGDVRSVISHDLTPTIHSLHTARLISRLASAPVPFHVEVDTGMHRAGIEVDQAGRLLTSMLALPHLRLQGLYMHFARADDLDLTSARAQLAVFGAFLSHLSALGINADIVHTANSAALFTMPQARFDLVRAGIATYGYNPTSHHNPDPNLRAALRLVSRVVRVHRVPEGSEVGYAGAFHAVRDTVIALVPVGYGDGFSRAQGESCGSVLIRERLAPIVGRVSMDQITVDVSEIPDVVPGDEVVIIGDQGAAARWADAVAADIGTISYEVMTSLLPRVPRIYHRSGQPVPSPDAPPRGL